LTPLLCMTQYFEDCDWLIVQEGKKNVFSPSILGMGFTHTHILFYHADTCLRYLNGLE